MFICELVMAQRIILLYRRKNLCGYSRQKCDGKKNKYAIWLANDKTEKVEVAIMNDFGLNEMQEMQKKLQDKYKNKWEQISPETGKYKLLWMIGEIGEVIDIVKKHGGLEASTDIELRKDLVEEMADVLMFYNDVMLCYGISVDELRQAYTAKFEKNMERW